MQAFLKFIERYHPHLLFLLLQLICFVLIVNHHHYQRVTYLHAANAVFSTVDKQTNGVVSYFKLKGVNEQLSLSNNDLLNKLYQKQIEVVQYPDTIRDTILQVNYQFTPAKVVNKTTNRQHNYLTINAGSAQGISKEMGVISEKGVVGIVKNVSENFATVMTLLHKESRVSGLLEKHKNFGSVKWDGLNAQLAQLEDIPNYVDVYSGEQVVTSGYSSLFPPNISIGKVKEANSIKGQNFKEITIDLATDFGRLEYVYVVNYLQKQEQQQLEAELQNE